jgi:hypothetical protein
MRHDIEIEETCIFSLIESLTLLSILRNVITKFKYSPASVDAIFGTVEKAIKA